MRQTVSCTFGSDRKSRENITVTGKIEANGSPIGMVRRRSLTILQNWSLSWDECRGRRRNGHSFAAGTGTETELQYEMVFKALAEGSTTLDVSAATAYMFDNSTLNLQLEARPLRSNRAMEQQPPERKAVGRQTRNWERQISKLPVRCMRFMRILQMR